MQLDPENLLDSLEEHMMKTEDALKNSFAAIRHRQGFPGARRRHHGRILRHPDPSARHRGHHRAGTASAGDPAVGRFGGFRD